MYRSLAEGDRVVFFNNEFGYKISERNPHVDSKYACVGTVTGSTSGIVYVLWDNGHTNDYRNECLRIIKDTTKIEQDPNVLFKRNADEI